jgi:hypothetical protein
MAKSVAKKVWRKPEIKVISAGSAESGPQNNRQDGAQVNNRS